ncbi:MAG: autotransporter-associated beta strand repeat-containing protein [Opitutaceae bacterium]|jgi:autotransporter-associated beta strand protein
MKTKNHSALTPIVCACALTALSLPKANATDYTWINTDTARNWTDTANWSPTGAPGAGDTIILGTVNDWGGRINTDITVANVTTDSTMAYAYDVLPVTGTGTTTLTITNALTANGGTKILSFRGDEASTASLNLVVKDINVTNQTVRFGSPNAVGTGGQRRELANITSTGVTMLGTGGVLMLDVAGTATLGRVQMNGGTLVLINENADALNLARTLTVAGLDGASGTIITSSSAANHFGSSTLTASDVRSGTLRINTAVSESHDFGGLIADKSSGVLGTITLSLVKEGLGTQTLSDANTYSGGTTVSGGTLLAANTTGSATGAGAVSVTGGTLGGTGFIDGATTVTGGALAAGTAGAAGTLTFNDTLDISGLTGTGRLAFDLGAAGASDKITLSGGALSIGTALLNFDDFSFSALSGFGAGTYTLFDTSTSIVGTLGSSLTGTINGLNATLSLSFDGTDILLTVASAVPEPATAGLLAGMSVLLGACIVRRKRPERHLPAA